MGAMNGPDGGFLVRVPPARRHGPQLPMTAESIELAVAAEADVTPGAQDGGRGAGDAGEDVLVLAEPGPPLGPSIDLVVRNEPPDLGVVVDVVALVAVILAPGPAIAHAPSQASGDPRLGDQLHIVGVQRHDRVAVLGAGVARPPL